MHLGVAGRAIRTILKLQHVSLRSAVYPDSPAYSTGPKAGSSHSLRQLVDLLDITEPKPAATDSMSQLNDPEAAHETLRLIDLRQEQILEDLDRLNHQIEALILLNTAQREEEAAAPSDSKQPALEKVQPQHRTSLGEAA